jgi:glucosyl-3-phosphoglycerate phosphatase
MLLVRHGQSEFNVAFTQTKIDPGIVDPCLTALGRQQALDVAGTLEQAGVRRLITSPYLRALETATIIASRLGIPVAVEPLVRERSAFVCDIGSSPGVLCERFPDLRFDHLDDPWWHDHVATGVGETEEAVVARGVLFQAAMASAPDRAHVAVVTHWGFIKALTGQRVLNGEIVTLAS